MFYRYSFLHRQSNGSKILITLKNNIMRNVDLQVKKRVGDYKEKMVAEIKKEIEKQGLKRKFFDGNGIAEPQLRGVLNNDRAYTMDTILVMIDLLGYDYADFLGRIK